MIGATSPLLAPSLVATLVVLGGTLLAGASTAASQAPGGEISGRLVQGSSGGPALDAIELQLIILGGDGGIETKETASEGARFRFEVVPDARLTYVVRASYQGVSYLAPPLLLSPELPTAEVELTLFESTRERPDLRIESTLVTVLVLDRMNAQLTLERIDEVTNPSDRVYLGDEAGVTLRLPLPDGVVEATGVSVEGEFALEGGTLVATAPLRPGTASVVTRYVVGYDRAGDAYTLRVTAPLATQQMEIEVPLRFSDDLDPLAESVRAGEREVSGERVAVIARDGAAGPGVSVSVRLEGLSGLNVENPLTGTAGAVLAVLVALAVVSGGALLLVRARGDGAGEAGEGA